MGWRFSKRIRVIPGVRINLSSKGISTTIGFKGANVNFSSHGTYLNAGIPGTGLSYRERLDSPIRPDTNSIENIYPEPAPQQLIPGLEAFNTDNILTMHVQDVTTQDMQGIKQAIIWAHDQRRSNYRDVEKIRQELKSTKNKIWWSKIFLIGLVLPKVIRQWKWDAENQEKTISLLLENSVSSLMNLDITFDKDLESKFLDVVDMYHILSHSEKIWDITASRKQNSFVERSAASTRITRKEVKFNRKNLSEVKCDFVAMHLENANGADLYIYPDFIIIYNNIREFAIIGFHEVTIAFEHCEFLEEGQVPADAKIVGQTWARINNNGTPDRRFKDNYQIPIVEYGIITLQTDTGLHEAYQFSHYEACRAFFLALCIYQDSVRHLRHI